MSRVSAEQAGDAAGAHHGTVDEPGEGEVLPRQADRRVDSEPGEGDMAGEHGRGQA